MNKDFQKLINKAIEARLNSYAPYSKFSVGSALITKDGTIFTGCNIENASLGLSICAERVAIYKAVSSGYKSFKALAIIGDTDDPCTPCGACRQVILEFSPDMEVIMTNLHQKIKITKAKELLPDMFQGENLKN